MPQLKSIYAGGYSETKKKRLESVVLPEKTECSVCHKLRTTEGNIGFSTKQLLNLKNAIATRQIDDPTGPWIRCRKCTPSQNQEMACCICLIVKGLDGFAKAQRRNPDTARCYECVADHMEEKPIAGTAAQAAIDQLAESDEESDDDCSNPYDNDSTVADTDSGVPLSNTLSRENLEVHQSTRRMRTNAATMDLSVGRGRPPPSEETGHWQAYAGGNGRPQSEAASGAEFTGFDAQGNAHHKTRAPSSVASDDSFASSLPKVQTAKEVRNETSRFARPEGPRTEMPRPTPYVGGRSVDSEDEDSDDSFGTI